MFHIVFRRSLRHSIALTYSTGSRNNSLAMAIALTYFTSMAALPSIIYLVSQVITSSAMLKILERKKVADSNIERLDASRCGLRQGCCLNSRARAMQVKPCFSLWL